MEESGAGEAAGAPQPDSPSLELTLMDLGSESPPLRRYARHPARREPRTVRGWRAGDVAELVCYVNWAGRTRVGHERRATRPFCELVPKAGRPREPGPEMEEGR